MTLSEISIRRPVFAWMLMFALIVFGGICFMRLGVSQLPDADFPVINVSLVYPGAAPEVMETDVVDIVENAVTTIQGVRQVTSSSRNGSANVTVELELERNIDNAMQDVQAKVSEARRKLPDDMDPPTITKTNPDDQPIMWLALSSDRHSLREMMTYVRDHVQTQFTTTPDVGDVFLGGYIDPNLRVWVDAEKLDKFSLTVSDIVNTIQTEHVELPGGSIISGSKEFNIRTMGEASNISDFGRIRINTRGGQPNFVPIYLEQIARIEENTADIRRISRSSGVRSVGLGIRKQRGANSVKVAEAVKTKMKAISPNLPEGMKLGIRFDSTTFIEESVSELNFTLLLAGILTSIVCWFFLGSWSSTLNVLLAIPTSIIGTFIILYFAGFTLNIFTLLGLSLAIGIVVDDAIMVLENIIRHGEEGLPKEQAALVGSKEITFAAVAATFSIVAIFLPVAFMQGAIGKFFYQFGVTMTAAVLLSLLEALTLTPMRCAQFVDASQRRSRIGKAVDGLIGWVEARYVKGLTFSVSHPWKIVFVSIIVFAASLYTIKFLRKEMAPSVDQSQFMLRIQTPMGSSLDYTDEKTKEVEAFLNSQPAISGNFVSVGGFGGSSINTAMAFITLRPKNERPVDPELKRPPTQEEFMNYCRKELAKIPDVKLFFQDLSMRSFGSGRGFPVEFSIQGPEWQVLSEKSKEIIEALKKNNTLIDIDSDFLEGQPEIQVIPDRQKAGASGVSISTIGQTVNALLSGIVAGRYEKGGHKEDVRIKLESSNADKLETIGNLKIRNNRGELIRLKDIVTLKEKNTLQSINRKDRERAVTIFANVQKGISQQKATDDALATAKSLLPPGYSINISGGSKAMKDMFNGLGLAFVMGLIVAYMVLASQFNSFLDPITVFVALPFSISGAFVSLLATDQSLNLYSFIGLILLMGIVKKNSILLVDVTNSIRDSSSLNPRDALLKACPQRLRPILMTSVATIAGAIPAALALGPGSENRVPMAITVIGGVLFSTLLTLFVVPSVYLLLARKRRVQLLDVAPAHA